MLKQHENQLKLEETTNQYVQRIKVFFYLY